MNPSSAPISGIVLVCALAVGCDGPVERPDATTEHDGAMGPADAGAEDGGEGGSVLDGGTGPTFTQDIYPLFQRSGCTTPACHGTPLVVAEGEGGLVFSLASAEVALLELSRDSFRTGIPILTPGDPESSELVLHARTVNVPAGSLSLEGLALLEEWVAAGATTGPAPAAPPPAPEPATCSIADAAGIPVLPASCLPRCTAETWDAVIACRSAADPATCQRAALDADPTPSAALGTRADPIELDCRMCASLQTASCAFEACPAEYLAILRCGVVFDGDCEALRAPLAACASASPSFRACQAERDFACVE